MFLWKRVHYGFSMMIVLKFLSFNQTLPFGAWLTRCWALVSPQ